MFYDNMEAHSFCLQLERTSVEAFSLSTTLMSSRETLNLVIWQRFRPCIYVRVLSQHLTRLGVSAEQQRRERGVRFSPLAYCRTNDRCETVALESSPPPRTRFELVYSSDGQFDAILCQNCFLRPTSKHQEAIAHAWLREQVTGQHSHTIRPRKMCHHLPALSLPFTENGSPQRPRIGYWPFWGRANELYWISNANDCTGTKTKSLC